MSRQPRQLAPTKLAAEPVPDIAPQRARHLKLGESVVDTPAGARRVTVDEQESPLVWLAKRRGKDGRPLVASHQLEAGEKLRATSPAPI